MSTFKPLDGMRKKFNETTGAYEGIADQNGDDAFPAARFQTAAEVDAARALVSRGGNVVEPVASRWVIWGDSFAAQSVRTAVPSSIAVAGGVATVAVTSHGLYSGARVSVTGAALSAANVIQATATRVNANSFTVPMTGVPDGAVAVGPASLQVLMFDRQTAIGAQTHLQRLSNGAITVPNVAGFPGYTTANILAEFSRSVAAFSPHVVLIQCGYNDLNGGVAEAATLANYQAMIDAVTGSGAVCLVQSISPWGAGAAANSALNRIKVQSLNRGIAAYCATIGQARFLDITALAIDPETGLSKTGWVSADGIHPPCLFAYNLAKLAVGTDTSALTRIKSRKFVSSKEDSLAGDAASLNVARSMPSTNTTGGSLGANVSATIPGGEAGTAGVAAGWTATGTSIPVSGGNAWVAAAPDGVGFAQACRWTMDGSGQQGRISYTLTNADFTPGEVVDVYFKASVTTAHAASNKTPAGQNMTAIQGQLVFTNTDGTFTPSDWTAAVAVAEMLQEDMVSQAIVIENVVVPTGSAITLARLDLVLVFGGAGTAQAMVWRAEVRKRTA